MTTPTEPGEFNRSSKAFATYIAGATVFAVMALIVGYLGVMAGGSKGAGTASGETKTFEIELFDIGLKPTSVDVPKGATVILKVKNTGQAQHDLALSGATPKTKLLATNESATLEIPAVNASTSAWCTVPGHKEAGMELKINVVDAPAGGSTASAASASVGDPGDAKIDPNAKPDAAFTARDPKAPAPLPGTVHEITFETTESEIEVAPGVTQQMWTFNEPGQKPTAPGPILRGKIGDTFKVTLINKGKIEHSIDFHASKVAWNDEMRSIKPGESLMYEFTANFAGAFMYHCGTAPALHHIGNGMMGAIIIDPPVLAPVAHEYVVVQSELYLGPQGQPGDLTKMVANNWDAVVFNGYYNQYKTQPIRVEPNERVRVWVVDDGPSENSAFHIVGTIFDTVYKEGTYLLQPDARQGGSQVLDLQPAQGGFVEFTFAEAGLYPIVTHKFSNVGKGALGLFQAGEVKTTTAAGH